MVNNSCKQQCPICEGPLKEGQSVCHTCDTDLQTYFELMEAPNIFIRLGRDAIKQGNYNLGISYYLIALELAPDNYELLKEYSQYLEEDKRYEEALQIWQNYLKKRPNDEKILQKIETLSKIKSEKKKRYKYEDHISKIIVIGIVCFFFLFGWIGHIGIEKLNFTNNHHVVKRPARTVEKNTTNSTINTASSQNQKLHILELSKKLPKGITILNKGGVYVLKGLLLYPWQKNELEQISKSWDVQFVDLRNVEIKYKSVFLYKVKRGDTLSSISKFLLGDSNRWHEIFKLNKNTIKNPNLLKIGQKIVVKYE